MTRGRPARRRLVFAGAAIAVLTSAGSLAAFAQPVAAPPVVSAPGKEIAREKIVFLYHHREDWSREHFQLHYVETHAPLGLKYTRNLLGYTVNVVRTQGGPDTITEQWVPTVNDLFDPKNSYASPEDFAKVTADRISDGKGKYYVVEEKVLRGAPLSAPLFKPTPGVKVVWRYRDASQIPPPPPGATRVVDNRVVRMFVTGDKPGAEKNLPSDVAVFRMAWANSLADLGGSAADALVVTEHRFRASPWK